MQHFKGHLIAVNNIFILCNTQVTSSEQKKATVYNWDETSSFHLVFLNVQNWG